MATYLAAMVATLSCVGTTVWFAFSPQTDRGSLHSAEKLANIIAQSLEFDAEGSPVNLDWPDQLPWLLEALPRDLAYQVSDPSGHVHLKSRDIPHFSGAAETPMSTYSLPINRGKISWIIEAKVSERLVTVIHLDSNRRIGGATLATTLLSAVVLGIVLSLTVKRLLRPLHIASAQAKEIGPRRISQRLTDRNLPSELRPLVQAFNEALSRLESGFRNQQRFLADAAHELKTPLSLLRGQIELNGNLQQDQLLCDIDHMTRQVQQLLLLTEVSETSSFRIEPIQLLPLTQEVINFLRPIAIKRQVHMRITFDNTHTTVVGDRMALFALVKNLLENALHFSPKNGKVELSLQTNSLAVRDQGPGISPNHLPHLFERFWRSPQRRHEGAGLGLSICEEIARSHGWEITVDSPKIGASFTLHWLN
ncbi:sensor histidine kinase [Sphaerotilus hippei]|nr:ATP-binding protein [Sphaerotilus hippei]